MKTLIALTLTLILPVSYSGSSDAQIARELHNIDVDLYQAEQQRQNDWQVQQNTHAIEREQDYQHSRQQREDTTDLRYQGKY